MFLPAGAIPKLSRRGVEFFDRGNNRIRLVCRFDGSEAEVDQVIARAAASLAGVAHQAG